MICKHLKRKFKTIGLTDSNKKITYSFRVEQLKTYTFISDLDYKHLGQDKDRFESS